MKDINETIKNSMNAVVLLSSFLSVLDKEELKKAKQWQKK